MLEKIFGEGFSKQAKSDKVFDVLNYIGLAMILLLVLYPLYFIVIASFSSPDAVARGEVWLLPVDFSTEGYQRIFEYKEIWTGYWNSLKYTVVGTGINLILLFQQDSLYQEKNLLVKM